MTPTADELTALSLMALIPPAPNGRVAECVDDYIADGRTLTTDERIAAFHRVEMRERARGLSHAAVDAFSAEHDGRTLVAYTERQRKAIATGLDVAGLGHMVDNVIVTRQRAVEIQAWIRASRVAQKAA